MHSFKKQLIAAILGILCFFLQISATADQSYVPQEGLKPKLILQNSQTSYRNVFTFGQDSSILATAGIVDILNYSRDPYEMTMKILFSLWDIKTGLIVGSYTRKSNILGMRFTYGANGLILASTTKDKKIELWDIAKDKLISTLDVPKDSFSVPILFSQDGSLLATQGANNSIGVWDVSSGKLVRTIEDEGRAKSRYERSGTGITLTGGGGKTFDFDFGPLALTSLFLKKSNRTVEITLDPKNRFLATKYTGERVKIWDLSSGKIFCTIDANPRHGNFFMFNSTGELLASFDMDNIIRVWSIKKGELQYTLTPPSQIVFSIYFTPDNKNIAVTYIEQRDIELLRKGAVVAFINMETGEKTKSIQTSGGWMNVISPDGNYVVWGNALENTLSVYDISMGKVVRKLGVALSDAMAELSDSGRYMILKNNNREESLQIWDVAQGKSLFSLADNAYAINPDETIIATTYGSCGTCDPTIKLWNLADGSQLRTLPGHEKGTTEYTFSNDGKLIASGGSDKRVKLWNVEDGKLILSMKGHGGSITSLAFSEDGRYLASGDNKGRIIYWDLVAGKPVWKKKAHKKPVWSLKFHPEKNMLASRSCDGTIKFWDPSNGKNLHTFNRYDAGYFYFSPDGSIMATGGPEDTVNLWDSETMGLIRNIGKTWEEHEDAVSSMIFTPDGKYVVTGNNSGAINVWEISSGNQVRKLEGHEGSIESFSLGAGGKILVSSSEDGTSKFWNMESRELLSTMVFFGEDDWMIYSPGGYFDSTPGGKQIISWKIGEEVYPAEKFWDQYYRPGLFARIMKGESVH